MHLIADVPNEKLCDHGSRSIILPPLVMGSKSSKTAPALLQRLLAVDYDDFRPVNLVIVDRPGSPAVSAFSITLGLLISGALLWSCLASIDEFTTASGRITPTGRTKIIQSFETAKVRSLFVESGQHVSAGAPLIALDPTEADADLAAKRAALQAIEAQIARRRAAVEAIKADRAKGVLDFPPDVLSVFEAQERAAMQADIDKYLSTKDQLTAKKNESAATIQRFIGSISARQRLVILLNERTSMKRKLVASSSGTLSDLLDTQQKLESVNADLAYDQGQLGEARASQISGQRAIEQSKSQALAEQNQALAAALEQRGPAIQEVVKAVARVDRMTLTSPVTGTVQQIAVTTVGQVVTAGQQLAVVVPSDASLSIEALIDNKDIRTIVAGQEAVIKIDAFPFTRYGVIEGEVTNVSREAVRNPQASSNMSNAPDTSAQITTGNNSPKIPETVFPVDVEMARTTISADGKTMSLLPGMSATVDIRTSRRRVISYLLSPIVETMSTAGHER